MPIFSYIKQRKIKYLIMSFVKVDLGVSPLSWVRSCRLTEIFGEIEIIVKMIDKVPYFALF